MPIFTGLINAVVTPFNESGEFDEKAYREIISWQLDNGLTGMFICGGGGEGILMSADERRRVADVAVDEVGDRGYKIVHVGALPTRECVELAKHAEGLGVDAISSLPPFMFGKDDDSVVAHFAQIVAAVDVPIFGYHLPHMTGVEMYAPLMKRLVDEAGVCGLKFTDYNLLQMQLLLEVTENLLYGRDEQLVAALVMGAPAGIGSTYNVMPNLFSQLWREFQGGDVKAARSTQDSINRVIAVLLEGGGIGACKEMLNFLGLQAGAPRSPNRTLSPEASAALKAKLEAVGYFDLVKK